MAGIEHARASCVTATVLVRYDRQRHSLESLQALLAAWAENPATLPGVDEGPRPRRRRAQERNGTAPAPPSEDAGPAWHVAELPEVLALLGIERPTGLTDAEAEKRRADEGSNALKPPPRRSEVGIFVDQLKSTPVAMLGASALFSAATGGIGDALAITAVLGINAGLGYVTESGAERTIASLTNTPQPSVPVLRNGVTRHVAVEDIVRGDLLVVQSGVFIAADARLTESHDLTVDESSLTGESVPVLKTAVALDHDHTPLSERTNMLYRGTLATGGSGLALVVATGPSTEIGQIQSLASGVEVQKTPMQTQLDRLGGQLALGATLACAATMGVGLLRGQALVPMLRTAVSLGVAAVPEGLPTVAITTLALGLSRMREERVIVRQLSAVETLGAVQVVCLDKTGTLTVNRMTVVAAQAGLDTFEVRAGSFVLAGERTPLAVRPNLARLLEVAVLCNEVELSEERGVLLLSGSPTEAALVQVALDTGFDVGGARASHPILSTLRRTEKRNFMSTYHEGPRGPLLAVKGRPSEVLAMCSRYFDGERELTLDAGKRAQIETENERMAGRALRVLGFAACEGRDSHDETPSELLWLGLVGMEDPPRDGVADVMRRFHRAGVRTVMITGDQSATALAVGKQVGLSRNSQLEIIDSTRLDCIDPTLLSSLAQRADVFSRVSPAHKLQIVKALQDAGYVVAMTGDGVNDGPALKAAHIGIAMGGGGSNVAREVADVVLENDELDTLVVAIEQGRTIYEDIRKAVHFILATNLSEILYTFTCVASGLGEPLAPMQLLWINLMTDIFPELALAVEPAESDVLARPPRDPARPMFTQADLWRIGGEGTAITAGALAAYFWTLGRGGPGQAGSVGFTALTFAQLLHAVSARSETHSIFDPGHLAKNPWLPIALGGTVVLQLAASFVPGLRTLLGARPLRAADWGVALLSAGVPFLVNETLKVTLRPPRAIDATTSTMPLALLARPMALSPSE